MQNARRWVVDTCTDIDRPDLIECAELGVSELVTNALLHADPPIQVRVRGTREHPRVEVRDGSLEPPRLPETHPTDEDELLLTFGRGLGIVARCADAWGAEIEDDGKVVWFAPSSQVRDELAEGIITGVVDPAPREPRPDDVAVKVVGVPLRTYLRFQHHYRELRREVRLLALTHEADYPLAKDLSDVFGSLERQLRDGMGADQIDAAIREGRELTDLHVTMPAEDAGKIGHFIELLDLADAFCREERLLSLARTPEQQQFQRWFLGEFVRQSIGESPVAWHDSGVPSPRSSVS
ncbi:ATP-binding protein [Nocardioides sp. MAHUQ-72]|uniref:ATP-binding protein n=1 Tax=unclassified Nocardioides TaxID=2615069 RepID=UPI0036114DF8